MKKATYIRCPRCELNYIKSTDKYCHVCLTELKLAGESTSVDEDLELCPVCGQNFISPEQKMCEDCAKQKGIDLEYDEDLETGSRESDVDTWEEDEDVLDDEVELIPLSAMEEDDEEDDESEEEDSDKPSAYDDDFEPAYLEDDDDFDEEDDDDDYEDDDDEYDD